MFLFFFCYPLPGYYSKLHLCYTHLCFLRTVSHGTAAHLAALEQDAWVHLSHETSCVGRLVLKPIGLYVPQEIL